MLAEALFDEKYCTGCKEYWPADGEFFQRDNKTQDGLRTRCKACCWEQPGAQRQRQLKREMRCKK